MVLRLSVDQVLQLRTRGQRLDPRLQPGVGVAQVVQKLCGLQSQLASAAGLTVRARSSGLTAADVLRAQVQERSVVRTWGLRGTLHWLANADLDWLLPLLGPVMIAASRRRYFQLGLDEDTLERGVGAIQAILASQGPLTRAELVERLSARGIRVEGQARPYLLRHAALLGVICFGPDRGTEPTYILLSDWINRELSPPDESAHTELARRYLKAHAPATPPDLAAWSGVPMRTIRAAWESCADQLVEVEAAGALAWILETQAAWLHEPPAEVLSVRLLPGFDPYLLGYRNRDVLVPRQFARRVNAGGGMLHPVVLVNGRVAGTWRSQTRQDRLDVVVKPFNHFAPELRAGISAEVADIARFLGLHAEWRLAAPE
jgi:hypothetical protein